jgi:hypothetical protein
MSNSCRLIKQNEKFLIKINLRYILFFIGSRLVTLITHNRVDIQENHHRKSLNSDENSTNHTIYSNHFHYVFDQYVSIFVLFYY